MIRFGLFVGVVASLYAIGQQKQAIERPAPAAIPMTVTLAGTRIVAPERLARDWVAAPDRHDPAATPRGFDLTATTLAASAPPVAPSPPH